MREPLLVVTPVDDAGRRDRDSHQEKQNDGAPDLDRRMRFRPFGISSSGDDSFHV
jgi:hypothetical protein